MNVGRVVLGQVLCGRVDFERVVLHPSISFCREKGIKLHAANSAGTLMGFGTDLDFVRPGIAMYGLPPGVYFTAYSLHFYFLYLIS